MEQAMVTQVAAYYDTDTRAFRVIGAGGPDGPPPERGVVAHELTHALADQHFGSPTTVASTTSASTTTRSSRAAASSRARRRSS
jgi:hypothetical protein